LEQFSISTMVVDSRKIVVGGVGMGSVDLKLRGMHGNHIRNEG